AKGILPHSTYRTAAPAVGMLEKTTLTSHTAHRQIRMDAEIGSTPSHTEESHIQDFQKQHPASANIFPLLPAHLAPTNNRENGDLEMHQGSPGLKLDEQKGPTVPVEESRSYLPVKPV
ncbi:hypothetical protein STEG23_030800, partial [Scotinomys teguina]